jgi:RNA polymerase sigma factor (sigma-70 family)
MMKRPQRGKSAMDESLDSILARHCAGDEHAREMLIDYVGAKIAAKVAKLLPDFPGVGRWDRPSDIKQEALMKTLMALADVKPQSERHLLNLAALQVKRVLIDKAREHARGGKGLGNLGDASRRPDDRHPVDIPARTMTGPGTYEQWDRFHACIDALPEQEREVFTLRWYLEADEETIASTLGVSRSTVQRAYRNAKAMISEKLGRRSED